VEQLLNVFGFLSVIARGISLSLQSVLIGYTAFRFLVSRPALRSFPNEFAVVEKSTRKLVFWAACGMAAVQGFYLFANTAILMNTGDLRLSEVAGAVFFIASCTMIVAGIAIAITSRIEGLEWSAVPITASILLASVATSHAWSRMEGRGSLATMTLLHQGAAGVWIGSLPFLLIALSKIKTEPAAGEVVQRFSRMAMVSVGILFAAGVGISISYIDSPNALYGTSYGAMVLSKVFLFFVLLSLGALNKRIVDSTRTHNFQELPRLRRFAEVEVGIGFTVILAAASLTSQPPAADLSQDRLSMHDIVERFSPKWPRFSSPNVKELRTPTRQLVKQEAEKAGLRPPTFVPGALPASPNTPVDIAWSEYNHHWAGLVVFALGILAVAARSGYIPWARNWPLVFFGLALFIFLRADPENWPLGANGFWESFLEAEVLQHRLFVLIVVAFALFEWRVQTGRTKSSTAALVFPAVCAVGGAMLSTHSHPLGNIKEETLAEWSHIPIGLLAVIAGWARWTELRITPDLRRFFSWIWPVCFVLIGTVLMLYREA
jgi:putative copper resistance protein D